MRTVLQNFLSVVSPVCCTQFYSHQIGSVFVDEGAESQAVSEGRGHVGDGHIPVALALDPAPLLQRLHGGHPGAPSPNGSVCERSGAAEASLSSPSLHSHTGGRLQGCV